MIASLRCHRALFSVSLTRPPLALSLSLNAMNFNRPIISHHIHKLQRFLSHLLVIKRIDFCSQWVINPTGLERLQRGSHREAFLMDSHREPSIHRANDIGLQDRSFREERGESSQEETSVQWDGS